MGWLDEWTSSLLAANQHCRQIADVEARKLMLPNSEPLPVLHLVLQVAVPAAVAFEFYLTAGAGRSCGCSPAG